MAMSVQISLMTGQIEFWLDIYPAIQKDYFVVCIGSSVTFLCGHVVWRTGADCIMQSLCWGGGGEVPTCKYFYSNITIVLSCRKKK